MTSTTQREQNTAAEANVFQPRTRDEEVTASVTRKMLQYHIIRVQLEGAKPLMSQIEREQSRRQAIEIRRAGFREEQEERGKGVNVSYDDELLRREGTRIAYMLARDASEEAARHVEQVVAYAVNAALYDADEQAGAMKMAA